MAFAFINSKTYKMIRNILALILATVLLGCNDVKTVDVSHITVDTKFVRTEHNITVLKDTSALKKIINEHPAFYNIYLQEVLPLYQGPSNDSLLLSFNAFATDSLVQDILKKVDNKYQDLSKIKKDLDKMYQHLKYYFPEITHTPDVYTFISEYAYQLYIFEEDDKRDGIALGLDMFMSPTVDYRSIDPNNTNFSDYITRSWNQDHIVKKIADIHIADIIGDSSGKRMIDQMIHAGKSIYISKLLLPEVADSILVEYTGEQLAWCEDNELPMWSFFLDQKLFYETNPSKINKYVFPSPNSPDMPGNAPGRTANYLGWKIVEAYMNRYPETTISDLIGIQDSQAFLEKSKYKPKIK